ncbi:hypothetical protein CIHG_00740 [Coccidioides immitis H538.4]|uniref:Uncharacterized protein n=3 Tax=Coccidioides immitis TaxID=5501 RepID=A0A0J8QKZ1_COCIT|nr:hypothetical protein CIRG_03159 [Coccidioides immitis RMSCC 2394]KMU73055.1 hypothetical protein CISG_03316 [Coccidioides immitis RMSCC 3703]KMU82958.1 hypothetical protein CIHG_00740 [Coccidioides immitis H538.4]
MPYKQEVKGCLQIRDAQANQRDSHLAGGLANGEGEGPAAGGFEWPIFVVALRFLLSPCWRLDMMEICTTLAFFLEKAVMPGAKKTVDERAEHGKAERGGPEQDRRLARLELPKFVHNRGAKERCQATSTKSLPPSD